MKKMLICGGNGFIGSNAINYFKRDKNYKIIATYNTNKPKINLDIEWIRLDLRNPTEVKKAVKDIDILIQCAATTSGVKAAFKSPDFHVTDNAIMNSIIFREAHLEKVKHLIFFSCTTMLKSSFNSQAEDSFDANSEIYDKYFGVGWTKVYLEKMCEFFSRQGSTKFTVFRHSNVYGPWDKYDLENSHVFGATVTKVLTSGGKVKIWGSGQEKRDLLYVEDLMEIIQAAICKQDSPFELFNAGGGDLISIMDLTKLIAKMANKQIEVECEESMPTVNFSVLLNNSKALRELGWFPKTNLETGIAKSIDFWNTQFRAGLE